MVMITNTLLVEQQLSILHALFNTHIFVNKA